MGFPAQSAVGQAPHGSMVQQPIGSLVFRHLLGSAIGSGLSAPAARNGMNARAILEAQGLIPPAKFLSGEALASNAPGRPEASQPDVATVRDGDGAPSSGSADGPASAAAAGSMSDPVARAASAAELDGCGRSSTFGGLASSDLGGIASLGNRELPVETLAALLGGGLPSGLHGGRGALGGNSLAASGVLAGFGGGLNAASGYAGIGAQGGLAGARSSTGGLVGGGVTAVGLAALLGGGGAAALDLVDSNIRVQIEQLRQARARHQELLDQSFLLHGHVPDRFLGMQASGTGMPMKKLLPSVGENAGGAPIIATPTT